MSLLNLARRSFAAARLTSELRCAYATKSIFVGNIAWATTEDQLSAHFQSKVRVHSVKLPKDSMNRGRGFGFIEIEEEDHQKAFAEFNETEFNGRIIHIKEANQKKPSF